MTLLWVIGNPSPIPNSDFQSALLPIKSSDCKLTLQSYLCGVVAAHAMALASQQFYSSKDVPNDGDGCCSHKQEVQGVGISNAC